MYDDESIGSEEHRPPTILDWVKKAFPSPL